jgi:hypothetical protein
MKQTAVEWLAEQFDSIVELYPSQFEKINRAIEQAKEMEKQQIMYAFNSGENSDDYFFPSLKLKECEVYYNETYKSK